MNRHTTKRRMARRMQKRRERILREDAVARYLRSMPYLASAIRAYSDAQTIRGTTAITEEDMALKKLRMAQMTIEGIKVGVEAIKVRTTPTEMLDRL